jgi:type VI secretion system protein ImpH
MAASGRRADPPLEQLLFEEPYRFEFFQAAKILAALTPDRAPLGHSGPPSREVARLHAHPSLSFPPSEIQRLVRSEVASSPVDVTVAFLGLTGPLAVLPHPYTELLIARLRAGDRALVEFLDLFNHRLVSFHYRAWEKYRPAASGAWSADQFASMLHDLTGFGRESRAVGCLPDALFLFYSGLFAQRRRPTIVLERLLSDYFGLAVRVEQFVGRWLRLDVLDRTSLSPEGPHNRLGMSVVVGARVWDEQSKFRLRVGPLSLADFRRFLPGEPAFRSLVELTRRFVDGEFDFDVQLILRAKDVPAARLSATAGASIGRFGWLQSRERTTDAEDAIFSAGV